MDQLLVYWHPQITRILPSALFYTASLFIQLTIPSSSSWYPLSCMGIIFCALFSIFNVLFLPKPLRNTLRDGRAVNDPWLSLRIQILLWNCIWPVWIFVCLPGTDVQFHIYTNAIFLLFIQQSANHLNSQLTLHLFPYLPNRNDIEQNIRKQYFIADMISLGISIGLSTLGLIGYFFFSDHQNDYIYFFLALIVPSLPTFASVIKFGIWFSTLSNFPSSDFIKRLLFIQRLDIFLITIMNVMIHLGQKRLAPNPSDNAILLVYNFPIIIWNVFHQALFFYTAAAVIDEYNSWETQELGWQDETQSSDANEETRLLNDGSAN